jgi:hypothetical protein
MLFRACDEESDRLVQGEAGRVGRLAATGDINGHRMGDELFSFTPNLNGIINFHALPNLAHWLPGSESF